MKKFVSILLVLMLMVSIIGGCSSKGKQTGENKEKLNPDAKLTVWSIITPNETQEMGKITDEFTQKTGIKVDVLEINQFEVKEKFITEAPTGQGPDIVMIMHSDTGELALMQMIRPLEFIDNSMVERFNDLAIDSFRYDGKNYGVGYSVESYGMVYNKDMIEQLPTTWDELFEKAEQLIEKDDKGNIVSYGFLMNPEDFYFNYPLYTGYGGYVFGRDAQGNFNADDIGIANEGSVKALTQLKSLVDKGLVPKEIQVDVINDFFANGKLAMMIYGPWFFNSYKENGINFDYAPIPDHSDGTPSQPFGTILGLASSNHSKYPKEADALIEFLMEDDNQQRLIEAGEEQRVTLNSKVYNSDYVQNNQMLKNITEVNLTAQAIPNIPEGPLMWGIAESIKLAIKGDLSVEDALKEAEEVMRENIKTMRE